jgi:hypothetical protein
LIGWSKLLRAAIGLPWPVGQAAQGTPTNLGLVYFSGIFIPERCRGYVGI